MLEKKDACNLSLTPSNFRGLTSRRELRRPVGQSLFALRPCTIPWYWESVHGSIIYSKNGGRNYHRTEAFVLPV
jgi:hypothetical protein